MEFLRELFVLHCPRANFLFLVEGLWLLPRRAKFIGALPVTSHWPKLLGSWLCRVTVVVVNGDSVHVAKPDRV